MLLKCCFYVEKPGLFTSVQDLGRHGHQSLGVPIGGAMDRFSAKAANWLVGNPLSHPVLEITLIGPILKFVKDCQVAICGGNLSPMIDQHPVPLFQTLHIKQGERLTFGRCISGCRAYLAIRGEWHMAKWLDSFSAAYPGASILTPEQVLVKGQEVCISVGPTIPSRKLVEPVDYSQKPPWKIAVLPGPEYTQTDPLSLGYFFSHEYRIRPESNRMGYRLNGPQLATVSTSMQISSGVMPGTIQITPSGQPIVLMADAQTTGGYPRIAQVTQASLDTLGQAKPGDTLHFYLQGIEEAREAYKKRRDWEKLAFSDPYA
ncbi:MAG: biotin-dependent carboxyltransferase family protein [Bacteroidota bacterium]